MKQLHFYFVLTLSIFSIAASARADDANYLMAVFNDTNSDITVSIDRDHSPCTTLENGTNFNVPIKLGPSKTVFFGFWRSGDCHGKQGWLAIRAYGEQLPKQQPGIDEEFQQFWFDADGGFAKHGKTSEYSNELVASKRRILNSTVALDFHIYRSH